jgi:hypothetical protein
MEETPPWAEDGKSSGPIPMKEKLGGGKLFFAVDTLSKTLYS